MAKAKVMKRAPQRSLFQRALPALVVLLVAAVGVWLLTASHADSLSCATVVDNKITFQICPVASNNTVSTKVTATSHFFGLVPVKSLLSVQQCDARGANCNNVVTTQGDYTDTGNAVYTIQSTSAPVKAGVSYRSCAFVADSSGWTGGACSPATASSLLSTAPVSTTTTTTPTATTTTTTTQSTAPTTSVGGAKHSGADPAAPPVTAPVPATPAGKPSASTTAAAAAKQKEIDAANAAAVRFYTAVAKQQKEASTFLTALANMCPSPRPLLTVGASGGCVKFLQFFLNVKNNAGLAVDGQFGPGTQGAVMNFQRAHGLSVDGVVGNQTWTFLVDGQYVPISQSERTVAYINTSGSSSGTSWNGRPPAPPAPPAPPTSTPLPKAQQAHVDDYFVLDFSPGIRNPDCASPRVLVPGHTISVRPPINY